MRNIHIKLSIRYLTFILIITLLSCATVEKREFPFTESEMIKFQMFGTLIEYAIFDNENIDFVKSIICDSLKNNQDIVFEKMIGYLTTDTLMLFASYTYDYNLPYRDDPKRIINMNIEEPDSIIWRSNKYSFNSMSLIVDSIALLTQENLDHVLKKTKASKNMYVPTFVFEVNAKTMDCEHGFIENVIELNKRINQTMDKLSLELFPSDSILIRPIIEIKT